MESHKYFNEQEKSLTVNVYDSFVEEWFLFNKNDTSFSSKVRYYSQLPDYPKESKIFFYDYVLIRNTRYSSNSKIFSGTSGFNEFDINDVDNFDYNLKLITSGFNDLNRWLLKNQENVSVLGNFDLKNNVFSSYVNFLKEYYYDEKHKHITEELGLDFFLEGNFNEFSLYQKLY